MMEQIGLQEQIIQQQLEGLKVLVQQTQQLFLQEDQLVLQL